MTAVHAGWQLLSTEQTHRTAGPEPPLPGQLTGGADPKATGQAGKERRGGPCAQDQQILWRVAGLGPWAFGPHVHETYACLQGPCRPDHAHTPATG